MDTVNAVNNNNNRKTHIKTSWATGLYAVGRGLLKFAVAMRMEGPYLDWERSLSGKEL